MTLRQRILHLVAAVMLGSTSFSLHAAGADTRALHVVATTGMLADAIREVGGNRVKVAALLGPGVDPHLYRQTHLDVTRLARADLVVYHGLNLEAQLVPLLADLARTKPVVALAETIPREALLADEENPTLFDPHVWMNPALWQQVVNAARDALISVDPKGKNHYEQQAIRYNQAINAMYKRTQAILHTVPSEKRVLITAHDAFQYFAQAYGYEVLAVQGISTESEASLHQIGQLVQTITQRKISAIFVESSVPDQSIRALAEGAAAQGQRVVIGGELYSDALGPEGTPEGTYLGMIEHNAQIIAKGLSSASVSSP
ncbi:metal ABC transporter solute-binding protein, Zn/Mn family [Pusillimonas sp. ANT_WB101]|uniref:metal ABC transporter solute-binding protein, Zn/Mn family n=1 Tax=Pusillimonas sp. ANT_WB101 TaxID=2597356 RepID=UPI0011EEB5E3|nr:zinc ABC transporter substrate-binding protein [Pusillimonas sp. ANT_WB101]KAA0910820.1 manganese transporter [Pusillimonas sp. ANT_WB101]